MADRPTLPHVDALLLIAAEPCERLTVPRDCRDIDAWTPDAQYLEGRWCPSCIARAGLDDPALAHPRLSLRRRYRAWRRRA